MKGNTRCAVAGCIYPIHGPNNLCDRHRVGGIAFSIDDSTMAGAPWVPEHEDEIGISTMVLSTWVAEHEDEIGFILLNDWALGDLFGGRVGFEARLARQGFKNIVNATLEEVEAAKHPKPGKRFGDWSGPWLVSYPWQVN
jgi:hypothetical protein